MPMMKVKQKPILREMRVLITTWDGTSSPKNRKGNNWILRLQTVPASLEEQFLSMKNLPAFLRMCD